MGGENKSGPKCRKHTNAGGLDYALDAELVFAEEKSTDRDLRKPGSISVRFLPVI